MNEQPLIKLTKVYKVYDMGGTDVVALDGVSLDLNPGEFLSIVGTSGSGKSTLLHIMGCLDTMTSGTMELEGHNLTGLPDRELSRIRNQHFGFVFQSYNLMPHLTALENVEQPLVYAKVPARERRERAKQHLGTFGLSDRLQHFPNQLSGGQQQRVAIARALVNEPSLILADEPTGNLNTTHSDAILNILQELHQKGSTVVVVTHDNAIANLAERKVELVDGKIAYHTRNIAEPAAG